MRRFSTAACAVLTVALLVGCGGDSGPTRYHYSGTVEFDGEPVPVGTIIFQPDASKGNDGPQGVATIVDGAFDTRGPGGKGAIPGPTIIRITGFKEEADPSSDEPKPALFDNFEIRQELSDSESDLTLEVPKSAGELPPPAGAGPVHTGP
ncbi:MAG TPA: hypothetical protein VHB77_02985 [Planctomycetaceae bacterium]|nr:hypothetical protein [Planctomycetaceae bacterium]